MTGDPKSRKQRMQAIKDRHLCLVVFRDGAAEETLEFQEHAGMPAGPFLRGVARLIEQRAAELEANR